MKKSKALWGSILVVGLLAVTVFVIYSAVKPSGAEGTVDYSRADLTPSDAWYVTDAAGVLSADTEAWLAALGMGLVLLGLGISESRLPLRRAERADRN